MVGLNHATKISSKSVFDPFSRLSVGLAYSYCFYKVHSTSSLNSAFLSVFYAITQPIFLKMLFLWLFYLDLF